MSTIKPPVITFDDVYIEKWEEKYGKKGYLHPQKITALYTSSKNWFDPFDEGERYGVDIRDLSTDKVIVGKWSGVNEKLTPCTTFLIELFRYAHPHAMSFHLPNIPYDDKFYKLLTDTNITFMDSRLTLLSTTVSELAYALIK